MADLGDPQWVHSRTDKTYRHKAKPVEEGDLECRICYDEIEAVPIEMSVAESYAYIENWVSEHMETCITPEHKAHIDQAFTVLAGVLA